MFDEELLCTGPRELLSEERTTGPGERWKRSAVTELYHFNPFSVVSGGRLTQRMETRSFTFSFTGLVRGSCRNVDVSATSEVPGVLGLRSSSFLPWGERDWEVPVTPLCRVFFLLGNSKKPTSKFVSPLLTSTFLLPVATTAPERTFVSPVTESKTCAPRVCS